jgi:hypothetical protein
LVQFFFFFFFFDTNETEFHCKKETKQAPADYGRAVVLFSVVRLQSYKLTKLGYILHAPKERSTEEYTQWTVPRIMDV